MDLLSRLLHRDGLMLVIDKPAGVPVHRGPKGGPSLEDAFDQLRFGLPRAPALAHRLDKDTSGCLVLGRHRKALERLGKLFKSGRISKTYWAVVEGGPEAEEGEIDLALGRLDAARGWWMQPDPMGLPSRTSWRVLGRSPDAALTFIEFTPHTGRTHQIRVHSQAMGWPILGDPVYGSGRREGSPPLHLHARAIAIPMQESKGPVSVEAPAPAHMREAMAACGWREDGNVAQDLPKAPEALKLAD
ncbi:RluA family pseudouridine synthase [Methylocystis parvus]|uniref:RluA family pseudouridine synthase n=1 Tax=Methylocystis parvus TaxID=134 RepID=UPI003C718EFE